MLILLVFYFCICVNGQQKMPDEWVQPLSPTGLRVSIADKQGIQGFTFYGKINEKLDGRESGHFGTTVIRTKNGRWTFYEPYVKLKVGDTLHYWTHIGYFDDISSYHFYKDDQKFVVTELIDKTLDITTTTTEGPTKDPNSPEQCQATDTIVNNKTSCSQKLIFNEQFDDLSSEFWTQEVKFAGSPDYEFVTYVNRDENLKVQNGILKITPTITDDIYGGGFTTRTELNLGSNCTGIPKTVDCVQKEVGWLILPPVLSAKISTKNKFSFKFGKIEIRAKLPQGDWIYPELYLNSRDEEYGPGYESGQITVAFAAGNKNRSHLLYSGGVLGTSPKARFHALEEIELNKTWADGFHKFGFSWTKRNFNVFVDDDLIYRSIDPPVGGYSTKREELDLKGADKWKNGTNMAPFDKEMYITVGVGVGGFWFRDTEDGSKPWKNYDVKGQKKFYNARADWKKTWSANSSLLVDYIKVWAL